MKLLALVVVAGCVNSSSANGMAWTPIRRPDLTAGFSVGAELDRVSVGTGDGAQSMLVGLH